MAQLGSFAYKTQDTTVRVISQTAALLHSKHDRGAGRVQNELNSQSARFAGTSQQNLAVARHTQHEQTSCCSWFQNSTD